jgi:hypothetical protein
MKFPRRTLHLCFLSVSAVFAWAAGCAATGSSPSHTTGSASGTGGGSTGQGGASSSGVVLTGNGGSDGGTPCTGLACQIHSCPGSLSTTISGTIYDPAGKNPLYGVVAYVPESTPAPITRGASCYSCGDLYTGEPLVAALSDANGNFTIPDAPDGADIPLVIQIGKWRRQFVLPHVALCADNALPEGMLTLPKNGGEGDLPDIAVSTGSSDSLECLLLRVGVDAAEYVPGASTSGHVHIFASMNGPNTNPPGPAPEQGLWDTMQDIMQYDMVLMSCEGVETENMNQQVVFDYTSAGGRVFASHLHYAWFYTGPFSTQNVATWIPGSGALGDINASAVIQTWNGTPFVRGQAFHDWLLNVQALENDVLQITYALHNADVTVTNTLAQPWLVVQGNANEPQTFTFDTPFGAAPSDQCGRVVYTDMHADGTTLDYGNVKANGLTPNGCLNVDLSPQEKAMEFNLFDLSSCVTPSNTPQTPPTMTK